MIHRSGPVCRLLARHILFVGLACAPAAASDSAAPLSPQPGVLAFAASHGLAVDGIDPPGDPGSGTIGDAITALVTLQDGARSRQWLVEFKLGAMPEHPKKVQTNVSVAVNGHNFVFSADATAALDIQVDGPFADGQKSTATQVRTRALISPEFLGLGLDSFCRIFLALRQSNPAAFAGAGSKPAGPPPVIPDRDLRIVAGTFPALMAFVQGIAETPGLREILYSIVDKPSAWSIIKRRGKLDIGCTLGDDMAAVDPAGRLLPGLPLYRLPLILSLNQQPALRCTLFVTAARPPLLATAGVVGIIAQSPSNPEKRLDIRLLSARRAPPPA